MHSLITFKELALPADRAEKLGRRAHFGCGVSVRVRAALFLARGARVSVREK